jgi:hypothetical protein
VDLQAKTEELAVPALVGMEEVLLALTEHLRQFAPLDMDMERLLLSRAQAALHVMGLDQHHILEPA